MSKEAESAKAPDQRGEHDCGTTGGTLPQETTGRGRNLTGIFRQLNVRETAASASDGEVHDQKSAPGAATDLFSIATPEGASVDPGFTQLFESLGAANTSPELPTPGPLSSTQASPQSQRHHIPGDPRKPASGEFTRLFERLDAPQAQGAASFDSDRRETSAMSHGTGPGGGFTQLLRTLSNESISESASARAPLGSSSMVQPSPEAPGEFTRILSRSALREASQRDAQNNLPLPHEGMLEADSRSQPPPSQAPSAQRQVLSALANHPIQSSALSQFTLPVGPLSTAVSAQMPRSGKLQEYVPLLLIANLIAMLVLILLVALTLIRHH